MEEQEKQKPESIHTEGGAYVKGDVDTQGGDFIGRDKIIHGDNISGDKISIGRLIYNVAQANPKPLFLLSSLGLLGIVGILAVLLWPQSTGPLRMEGQFNVAVADIQVLGLDDKPVQSDDGSMLAKYLSQQIHVQFEELELQKVVPYEVWGPELTGLIGGENRDLRAQHAEQLAQRIGAHIVIFGTIIANGKQSHFDPEYFINHDSFQDAEEITGQYELGQSLRVALPFGDKIQAIENPALAARANALNLITLGLAYYSIEDFDNARIYFGLAAADQRWLDSAGKEIAYLLLGNTSVRQVSKEMIRLSLPIEKVREILIQAIGYYNYGLRIQPDYGRALVGKASAMYSLAVNASELGHIDMAKLEEVESLLDQVLLLQNQPESANLETKVHFYRGQVALARFESGVSQKTQLAQAEQEFQKVIEDYEDGDYRVAAIAGHAQARLGVIAYLNGNLETAIRRMEQAVELVSPFYQGEYQANLGNMYAAIGQLDLAREAYKEAILTAEANGDAVSVTRYSQKLNELQGDTSYEEG